MYTILHNKINKIKYLYQLKNGYFICSFENNFYIYRLIYKEHLIRHVIIQEINYANKEKNDDIKDDIRTNSIVKIRSKNETNIINNNNRHYQIIELINGNLIMIDRNKLIILEPSFNNKYKKKDKDIDLNSNIICLAEINKFNFCTYSENNCITIFDPDNFKEKSKIKNIAHKFRKIEAIENYVIAAMGTKKIYLISIPKSEIFYSKSIGSNMIDMCTEQGKIYVAYKDYIYQYNIDLNNKGNYLTETGNFNVGKKINFFCLNKNKDENNDENIKIICVYDNTKINIY